MNPSANPHVGLDPAVREGLGVLAAELLPGTPSLPSALDVGAHLQLLDAVLTADPELAPSVYEVGRRVNRLGAVDLETLRSHSVEAFERTVFALNAAYYMAPTVLRALGYPGQVRRPVSQATPDEVVTSDLLAPVIARGPVYVPTPGAGE